MRRSTTIRWARSAQAPPLLERADELVAVTRAFDLPVDRAVQGRGGGEDEQVLAAVGGLRGVGAGGGADVDARVVRHAVRLEHRHQVAAVVGGHELVVVGELRVGALDAQQQHHAPSRRARSCRAWGRRISCGIAGRSAVGSCRRRRSWRRRRRRGSSVPSARRTPRACGAAWPSPGRAPATRPAPLDQDLLDRAARSDLHPELAGEPSPAPRPGGTCPPSTYHPPKCCSAWGMTASVAGARKGLAPL